MTSNGKILNDIWKIPNPGYFTCKRKSYRLSDYRKLALLVLTTHDDDEETTDDD